MAKVTLRGVVKRFGLTVAVDDIDLDIADGELTSFLGPSGCGKTTTLRMIAGLERPSEGRITIGDDLVFGPGRFVPPERREIGMVFQSYAIWPHLTVFENVAFPLRVRRLSQREVEDYTRAALATVRLENYADRYPAELSGGQQQRVALGRAIVFQPRILLLDEPLSNLDVKLREEMRGEIRALQQRLKVTALFVTHDQSEALALSDRVAVMDRGRIVQYGTPRAIYERPGSRFVAEFVGWSNMLNGEVADHATVLVNGRPIPCAVPPNLKPGGRVRVTLRPTDAILVEGGEDDGPGVLAGKLRTAMFMGDHVACEVIFDNQMITVRAPVSFDGAAGQPVGVRLPAERILILEE